MYAMTVGPQALDPTMGVIKNSLESVYTHELVGKFYRHKPLKR